MTNTRTHTPLLEELAARITTTQGERDCGIAWAEGEQPNLRKLLPGPRDDPDNLLYCPVEPATQLISLLWEGTMGHCSTHRLLSVELPSGRELLVVDDSDEPGSRVIGVVDREHEHAHLRAFQAVISGEKTSDPILIGFPAELGLAYGGVVLVDALAEGLRRSPVAGDYLSEENADYFVHGVGVEAKERLITALEEELEEPSDPERAEALEKLLERASWQPAWLWAIEAADAARIAALAKEQPPIPLYSPPGIPDSLDPLLASDDRLYLAAALLVVCGEL